jgi:glutathione S-transferase
VEAQRLEKWILERLSKPRTHEALRKFLVQDLKATSPNVALALDELYRGKKIRTWLEEGQPVIALYDAAAPVADVITEASGPRLVELTPEDRAKNTAWNTLQMMDRVKADIKVKQAEVKKERERIQPQVDELEEDLKALEEELSALQDELSKHKDRLSGVTNTYREEMRAKVAADPTGQHISAARSQSLF